MAKDQKELLTELKNGSSSFSLIGKVKLVEGGFGGAVQKEKSNWLGVNSKFGVEISDGNVIYPAVRGGYMLDNPVLKKFGKDKGTGLVSIPYAKRHDENILSGLAQYAFMRGAISKDETGRPEVKKFIDAIDFEAYLAENLYDGMDIKVNGDVEYSPGKEDEVYRNYTVTSIYLNEEYKKNEEVVPQAEPRAIIHQTYVFDDDVISNKKGWKKDFQSEGQVVLTMYAPQYISKRKVGDTYVEWKKVMPLRQNVYIKGDPTDEKSLKLTEGLIKRLFTIKEGVVRELTINSVINEGYTTQTGDFEISKDMQELINLGLISEEEVKKSATVRGSRTSELIFLTPATNVTDDGEITISMDDEKYAPEVLFTPDVDSEEETEAFTKKSEPVATKETEDAYGETENEGFNSVSFEDMFQ